jgi:hypothetical protein
LTFEWLGPVLLKLAIETTLHGSGLFLYRMSLLVFRLAFMSWIMGGLHMNRSKGGLGESESENQCLQAPASFSNTDGDSPNATLV